MSEDRGAAGGLRERKKTMTREAIRSEALRMFEERGYHNTTVEQVAAVAEVSPSTFFRYFPNKAATLVSDGYLEPILELFLQAPPEMTPIAALRYAARQIFDAKSNAVWELDGKRQQLLFAVPEAAHALYNFYILAIDSFSAALAQRLDREADDPQIRATAGAVVGVIIAAGRGQPMEPEATLRALDFLDAGLPLT